MTRKLFGVTVIEFVVVVATILLLIGLFLPAIQFVRESARRISCQNNVKQIALALHSFDHANSLFPPGYRSKTNARGLVHSGWTLSILPYAEQNSLYDRAVTEYGIQRIPFHPPHSGLSTTVPLFACPSDGRVADVQYSAKSNLNVALTSYLGMAGMSAVDDRNGVLFSDSKESLKSITDGLSNTLLVGERPPSTSFRFGWWYAGVGQQLTGSADLVLGVREPNTLAVDSDSHCGPGRYPYRNSQFQDECGTFHYWSPHVGGSNFAFADGSIRLIPYSANDLMPALASRAGQEVVEAF